MATQTTPEVSWAQRSNKDVPEKNLIYLTVAAPDVPKAALKVDLQPGSLALTGKSETKQTTYHVTLPFYADIDVEHSATHHTERDVEFVLRKKESAAEFWPRLTKDKQRLHFLKTNFDKWVDEDEQEDKPDEAGGMGGMDLGGMGMGGMGPDGGMGMGGMGPDGGMGGLDFSKLGAMGGGMEGLGAGAEDPDDDEMPDLDVGSDDEAAGAPADAKGKGKAEDASEEAAKPKIEEVA